MYLPAHYLDIDTILQNIRSKLDARNEMLPGLNKELNTISRKLVDYTRKWCGESSLEATDGGERASTPEAVYMMNCPGLHPHLAKDLLPRVNDYSLRSPQQIGLPSVRPSLSDVVGSAFDLTADKHRTTNDL
jgi:hypothetical protein